MTGGELDSNRGSDLTCVGSSSGGAPAIFSAIRLNAQRCISVCGYIPDEWGPCVDQLSGSGIQPRAAPGFLYVHGEHYEADRENALQLQSVYGGAIVTVPSVDKHNVLHAALQQGRFQTEFNALMHGAPDPWRQGMESHAAI
jgi:hypothetical protein